MKFTYRANATTILSDKGIHYGITTSIIYFLSYEAEKLNTEFMLIKISKHKTKSANKFVFERYTNGSYLYARNPNNNSIHESLSICYKLARVALNTKIVNKITLYIKFEKLVNDN